MSTEVKNIRLTHERDAEIYVGRRVTGASIATALKAVSSVAKSRRLHRTANALCALAAR